MTDVLGQDLQDPDPTVRPRRRWVWIAGVLLVVVAAFVLFWFQPHKLYIDDRVDEDVPAAGPPATTAPGEKDPVSPTTLEPAGPSELSRGAFVSRDHGTSGVARVLELADGRRILRLEGLDTDNGPDLYVYLTANPANGDEGAFDDTYLSLGRLKGNQGDQNYDIPPDTALDELSTVVVWCDRFDSAFGAADLAAA